MRVRIFFQTISRLPAEGKRAAGWEDSQCHGEKSQAQGEYYVKGDTHYCLYEEQPEGWDELYKVTLKWKAAVLERQIRGKAPSKMVFEPGKCHSHIYRTPYGDLLLETETHRLEITKVQGGFFLALEYGIKQDGQIVSENRMEIRIREAEESI